MSDNPLEDPKNCNTLLVCPSDMHSGGSTALFPHYNQLKNGFWQFKHTRYTPSGKQCDLANHWDECADKTATARQGKRLIIVGMGDMIDGSHHHTLQLATHNVDEQKDVHVWLMQRFMNCVGFDRSRGDKFYVLSGTEVHTGKRKITLPKNCKPRIIPKVQKYLTFYHWT